MLIVNRPVFVTCYTFSKHDFEMRSKWDLQYSLVSGFLLWGNTRWVYTWLSQDGHLIVSCVFCSSSFSAGRHQLRRVHFDRFAAEECGPPRIDRFTSATPCPPTPRQRLPSKVKARTPPFESLESRHGSQGMCRTVCSDIPYFSPQILRVCFGLAGWGKIASSFAAVSLALFPPDQRSEAMRATMGPLFSGPIGKMLDQMCHGCTLPLPAITARGECCFRLQCCLQVA